MIAADTGARADAVSSLNVMDSATGPSSSVGELSMPLDPRKIHFRGVNRDVVVGRYVHLL